MSEKLDGWRLLWDGKQYLTRQGNVLECPASWYQGMPSCWLDGEMFAGRGKFNQIQGMIRDGFDGLAFHVFDVPSALPFSDRLQALALTSLPIHCEKVDQRICAGYEDAVMMARQMTEIGGEGVVLRNPSSEYEEGRSWNVLRIVPQDPALNRV